MAPVKRLKANELVMLLAELLNLDVELMARVGNIPSRNLKSWLAGKKENLRLQSVVSLLSILGLKFEDGIRLSDDRVHFWRVNDGTFSRSKTVYEKLSRLSKLMSDCMITRIEPTKKRFFGRRDYYMISGEGVRVVVIVKRGIFKSSKVGPEVIKGACWRDESDHHTITANKSMWANLVEMDLTTHEFDRIFAQSEDAVTWSDLSLIAREFGVTPANLSDWIMSHNGEEGQAESEDGGIEIDGGGQLLALVHRRAA